MKSQFLKYLFFLSLGILSLSSCEDVIEVDTPSGDSRLIIDALVRIDTTQPITVIRVKVSETNGFFETTAPADLQQITLSNLDNPLPDAFVLTEEEPGSGIYSESIATAALLQDRWLLQIDFEDEFYLAEATFARSVPVDDLEQGDRITFDEDDTEVIITYTDLPEEDNYYVFDFGFGEYFASEDTFYQDQQFSFSYFYDEENVEVGTEVTVSILGADAEFYNYMNQLIEQSDDGFNPFQTPTLTVRGNFINATDIDNDETFDNVGNENNFALGYFALVQVFSESLVIEEL